jgi:hypothetical protein
MFELLTELSVDPFTHDAFLRDPEGVAAAAGLSLEERAALFGFRRDDGDPAIANGVWARCACCADPGPDPEPNPDPSAKDA